MRKLKTVALVAAMYLLALLSEMIMTTSSAEYQGGVSVLLILGVIALVAPKVGYRWFDCLFAAIPIYGIFFIFRIAYRLAYLPKKDWAERNKLAGDQIGVANIE